MTTKRKTTAPLPHQAGSAVVSHAPSDGFRHHIIPFAVTVGMDGTKPSTVQLVALGARRYVTIGYDAGPVPSNVQAASREPSTPSATDWHADVNAGVCLQVLAVSLLHMVIGG